jgi:hypothetical protein
MNDHEHDRSDPHQHAPEVQREREVIVTNTGGQRSGPGTALVVILGLVAVVVIAFIAFTFLERDGGEPLIPDDIDVNIQVPEPEVEGDS